MTGEEGIGDGNGGGNGGGDAAAGTGNSGSSAQMSVISGGSASGAGSDQVMPSPVRAGRGQMRMDAADLSSDGFGQRWGQTRSYSNVQEGNGNGWLVSERSNLNFDGSSVEIVRGANRSLWFGDETSGVYSPEVAFHGDFRSDATAEEFAYTDTRGNRRIFYDNSSGTPAGLRGQLKGVVDPYGGSAQVSYDTNDRLEEVSWQGGGGESEQYLYAYDGNGNTSEVTLKVGGELVRRTRYDYWTEGETGGNADDLKQVTVEEYDATAGEWKRVSREFYRYWEGEQGNALKYQVLSSTYDRMEAEGVDPETASDTTQDPVMAGYADRYFEYDIDGRVTKQKTRGGANTYEYAYLQNSTSPGLGDTNTWAMKTTMTLPGGTKEKRYYTNAMGGLLLKVYEDTATTGAVWYRAYEKNDDGFTTQMATSEAVASVTEPSTGSGTLTINLETNAGLIEKYDIADADNPSQGEVKNYLKSVSVKEGTGGTADMVRKLKWDTRTVDGVSIHPPEETLTYPTAGMSDNDAPTTSYSYTYFQDEDSNETFQVKEKVTTLPVIPTSQNGDGQTYTVTEQYDEEGRMTWRRDARGYIFHWSYDQETGAMTRMIEDVDTTQVSGVPAGWTTPAGGGLNLITDYENDGQGRTVKALGPARRAVLKESDNQATDLRTVDFTVYRDDIDETWSVRGYATGSAPNYGYETVGAVSITRTDSNGRVTDQIQSIRACACGPLQPTETFPQENWTRWTKNFYDDWGRMVKTRVYYNIPVSGEGKRDTDYAETRYAFDTLGRTVRVLSPGGTITRTIYDERGMVDERWVGTDDTGWTDSNPNGSGAPNNMRKVAGYEYDNDTAGGNGLLTKEIMPVNGTEADDRWNLFTYDYRNRLETTTSGGRSTSVVDQITKNFYDNIDRLTQVDTYHSSVTDANRTGQQKTEFDNQNRVCKTEIYAVNSAGTPGNALVSQNWFDPNGNVMKAIGAGSEAITKTVYDGLDRPTISYLVWNTTTSSSSNDNNVTNDTVVEQTETTYDEASNAVAAQRRERFDDATGTGALNGPNGAEPNARVSYAASWFDGIDRLVASTDYGTNGGADLERPDTVPDRSDTVLVNSNRYRSDGDASATIDPMGTETRWENDKADRRTKLIENYDPEAESDDYDANRTAEYLYNPDSLLECLILVNAVTGNQVTRWVYGTTIDDSEVARADLLRAKIYPMADDEAEPTLDDGIDGVYERIEYEYNRQGQVTEMKDPNETVHAYSYDILGRTTDDSVTTFGTGIDQSVKRISTTYNNRSLIEKVTSYDAATGGNEVNQVEYEYDDFNQLTADKQEHGGAVDSDTLEVAYEYADGSSGNTARRTAVIYPNAATPPTEDKRKVSLLYPATANDRLSRVGALKVEGDPNNLCDYTFVGLSRYVKIGYVEPAVQLSYIKEAGDPVGDAGDPYTGYDRFGRTVEMRWETTGSPAAIRDHFQWGYDRASNRTWRKNLAATSGGQDEHYGYDGLYQVKSDALGTLNLNRTAIGGIPAEEESFSYDPTGNWLGYEKAEDGATTIDQSRVNNQDNQMVQVDGKSEGIACDRVGNATLLPPDKSGDFDASYALVWDAWNRLVEVKDEAGTTTIATYAYDGLTRRTTKTVSGTTTHFYYNDRWKSIHETEGTAVAPARQYIWGERPGHRDELILRDRDTDNSGTLDERLYALMDYFNCTSIIDSSGDVEERYAYSAFGVRRIMTSSFGDRATSSFAWDFNFQGQFRDDETAYYNYGYRYYVPWLGRWPNRDPIGEGGGTNLYAFVGGNPIASVDLLGLSVCSLPGAGLLGYLGFAAWHSNIGNTLGTIELPWDCFDKSGGAVAVLKDAWRAKNRAQLRAECESMKPNSEKELSLVGTAYAYGTSHIGWISYYDARAEGRTVLGDNVFLQKYPIGDGTCDCDINAQVDLWLWDTSDFNKGGRFGPGGILKDDWLRWLDSLNGRMGDKDYRIYAVEYDESVTWTEKNV